MELLFNMLAETGRNHGVAKLLGEHSRGMRAMLIDLIRRGQERAEVDALLDAEVVAALLVSLVDGIKGLPLRNPDWAADRRDAAVRLLVLRLLTPHTVSPA